MLETVFDVDGFPGGLGSLVCFRLQVAPKNCESIQLSPLDPMRFSQEDPCPILIQSACFTWDVPKSNRRVIWFQVPGRFNFFEYVYPMLGPQGCNHGIFCKNIRISRPSLHFRWWQLKYFFIFTPITWGNDPIWRRSCCSPSWFGAPKPSRIRVQPKSWTHPRWASRVPPICCNQRNQRKQLVDVFKQKKSARRAAFREHGKNKLGSFEKTKRLAKRCVNSTKKI